MAVARGRPKSAEALLDGAPPSPLRSPRLKEIGVIRTTALALVMASALTATARAQTAPYTPPEGDFSVDFPAQPEVQIRPAHRSRDVAHRRYVTQEPARALVVAIDDYPDGVLPQAADAGVYDKMLRTRADDDNAQLVSTRPARLSGRPCLEGRIVDTNGVVEEIRVLMVGDRIYQLTFVHPDGADPAGADAAFFSSFKISPANPSAGPSADR
jgi:hypothetical protein